MYIADCLCAGSKKLKAVLIEKTDSRIDYNDEEKFKELSQSWAKMLAEDKKSLTQYGTAVLVNAMNEAGCLATESFNRGTFAGAEDISGEYLKDLQIEREGEYSHSRN